MQKYKGYELPTTFDEIKKLQKSKGFLYCKYFILPMISTKTGYTVMHLNTRIDIDDLETEDPALQFKICTKVASKAIEYIDTYLDPEVDIKKDPKRFDITIQVDGIDISVATEYMEFEKSVLAPDIYKITKYINTFLSNILPDKIEE